MGTGNSHRLFTLYHSPWILLSRRAAPLPIAAATIHHTIVLIMAITSCVTIYHSKNQMSRMINKKMRRNYSTTVYVQQLFFWNQLYKTILF